MENLIKLLNKYIELSNEWSDKIFFDENGKINKPGSHKWNEALKKESQYNKLIIAIAEKLGKETHARQLI